MGTGEQRRIEVTLTTMNTDKLIDNLFTLPREKDIREGDFSLTLKEEDRPGLTISLTIQARQQSLPHAPEREVPRETPTVRTFHTTTYFLRECHRQLFADNQGKERQLLISGASVPQDSYWLDIMVAVKLKHASAGGVEADIGDLFSHLADLDEGHGLLLTGIFHSHLWRGRGAVHPSATDRALQDTLEASGYKTVQAVFSEDAYIGFFTNTVPFQLAVLGTGYEEVETHAHQTVVQLTQSPHLSHQTLHTAQSQGGWVCRPPESYRRV
jgi:hypothetical protein